MQRYPEIKVVVAHGKASRMGEVLEKDGGIDSHRPPAALLPGPHRHLRALGEGKVMLGFDAEERLIQKLPNDFAEKVVWGSCYPHHGTTSAWDAIDPLTGARVDEATLAQMFGGNAAAQFGVAPEQAVHQ